MPKLPLETDIIAAIQNSRLIGDSLSPAQETALRVLYGLPLTAAQRDIYAEAVGQEVYDPREFREAMFICGRRAGKSSRLAANIALYEACFRKHELDRGEVGHVVVLAPTKKQATVTFDYIVSRLENSPTLRALIVGEPYNSEVELSNAVTISVWPCNFRSIRGISIICAVCDEIAYWRDDVSGANPAGEVLKAVRPAMASFPNAKLVKISSPFAKQGVVWEDFRDRAQHPELLVWRLSTREMNPSLDPEFLDQEERRDPESFAREYGAEFYESASAFLPADAVEACVIAGRYELLPQQGTFYTAALDAAFRGDFFAFAIVHRVNEKVIEDFIRSWRGSKSNPVNLSATLEEIAATMKRYGIGKIHGDQFCSEPIRQFLQTKGISFEQSVTLGSRASGIWNSLRTLIASRQLELLQDETTIAELKRLELVVTSGGNQRVEASVGHDDRAVVVALAAHQAISQPVRTPICGVVGPHGTTWSDQPRSNDPFRDAFSSDRGWIKL